MKTKSLLIKSVLIIFLAYLMITQSDNAKNAVLDGLQLCANAVLPVLFPFTVLSDLWVRCGAAGQAAALFSPLMRTLFHLPGSSASAFLLGSIGGYPVGARTVSQLYRDGALNKNEAEQALMFCNNAGPSFIIGVVGLGILQSISAGILLYIIHLSCAIGIGLLFRQKHTTAYTATRPLQEEPFLSACKNAISEGGKTTLTICIFVLFFSILTRCISALLPVSIFSTLILPGLLEMTSGLHALAEAGLQPRTVFTLSALFLGLGGGCVILQAITFTEQHNLSCRKLLLGKCLHGPLSAFISYLAWLVLPTSLPYRASESTAAQISQGLIILLVLLPFLLFLKKSSRNKKKNLI